MSVLSKTLGTVGIVGGVVGAAVVGGMTAQRRALTKHRGAGALLAADSGALLAAGGAGPIAADGTGFDELQPDRTYSVVTTDGVVLHVEEAGPLDAPLTVVFAHGWALRMGSWHYQRLALAGPGFGDPSASGGKAAARNQRIRMVFYDQRSHGRSSRGSSPNPPITQLATDLSEVLATAAPDGPVVLVGHSMGGMATLALAGADPDFIAERVVGVGLLSTSASQIPSKDLGKIFLSGRNPVLRLVSVAATRYAPILERTRASTRDAVWLATRHFGFARRDVPAALVDYLDRMLSDTPIDVITDFVPGVLAHNQSASLPALVGIPVLVLVGDSDRITPPGQSMFIAQALPDAEFVTIPQAGHVAMLEAPDPTNEALRKLFHRALAESRTRRITSQAPDLSRGA
jgi:pimeloyl-ACP methyl ester carboxylesterase